MNEYHVRIARAMGDYLAKQSRPLHYQRKRYGRSRRLLLGKNTHVEPKFRPLNSTSENPVTDDRSES